MTKMTYSKQHMVDKINANITIMNWMMDKPNLSDELECRKWIKTGKLLLKENKKLLADSRALGVIKVLMDQMKKNLIKSKRGPKIEINTKVD